MLFQDWDQYGIDCEEEVPQLDDSSEVQVPLIAYDLPDDKYQELCEQVDPLQEDDGHGIDTYLQAGEFVTALQSE